ncbi:hypothetical protein J3F83DRAFT_106646 [Trichoderma novae-zelandiae]
MPAMTSTPRERAMSARQSRTDHSATGRKRRAFRRLQGAPETVDDCLILHQRATPHAVHEASIPAEVKDAAEKEAAEAAAAAGEVPKKANENAATGSARKEEASAVEHSYWPIVRQYIDNGGHAGHASPIKPVCPICSDELTVHGVDPAKDEAIERAFYSVDDEMPPFTRCATIFCGHMFCPECLARAFGADREMRRRPACPVCRFEVDCEQCGRLGRVVNVPVTGIAARCDEFPRTRAEGGCWPSRCSHCLARAMWVSQGRHAVIESVLRLGRDPIQAALWALAYEVLEGMEKEGEQGRDRVEEGIVKMLRTDYVAMVDRRSRYISNTGERLLRERRDVWQ